MTQQQAIEILRKIAQSNNVAEKTADIIENLRAAHESPMSTMAAIKLPSLFDTALGAALISGALSSLYMLYRELKSPSVASVEKWLSGPKISLGSSKKKQNSENNEEKNEDGQHKSREKKGSIEGIKNFFSEHPIALAYILGGSALGLLAGTKLSKYLLRLKQRAEVDKRYESAKREFEKELKRILDEKENNEKSNTEKQGMSALLDFAQWGISHPIALTQAALLGLLGLVILNTARDVMSSPEPDVTEVISPGIYTHNKYIRSGLLRLPREYRPTIIDIESKRKKDDDEEEE